MPWRFQLVCKTLEIFYQLVLPFVLTLLVDIGSFSKIVILETHLNLFWTRGKYFSHVNPFLVLISLVNSSILKEGSLRKLHFIHIKGSRVFPHPPYTLILITLWIDHPPHTLCPYPLVLNKTLVSFFFVSDLFFKNLCYGYFWTKYFLICI